jgi:hypothetical protein
MGGGMETTMTKRKAARMPNLDFDEEAMANLRAILAKPHHPSAAEDNLGRQRRALREARQREAQAEEK